MTAVQSIGDRDPVAYDLLAVHALANTTEMAEAAAQDAGKVMRSTIALRGRVRVVFASAPSQNAFISALMNEQDIDWVAVEAFHMDEYIGLPVGAEQSFAHWIAARLEQVRPGRLELLDPGNDPESEAQRYAEALGEAPIDLACVGVGVNGHIAFNEPRECRFDDPVWVRSVAISAISRQQQVDDGCFSVLEDVPGSALTLTIPVFMRATNVVAVVPGLHKAAAVSAMLTHQVGEALPATVLRNHPGARLYLDAEAASRLPLSQ